MRFTTIIASIAAIVVALAMLTWVTGTRRSGGAVGAGAAPGSVKPNAQGEYPSNPFVLDRNAPHPTVGLESPFHEFERMAVGEKGTASFVVRNEGNAPLKLALGESTCKCTVGEFTSGEVQPGGSTEVNLEWHPPTAIPMFGQTARIWTNDPDQPSIDFTISGEVVNRVMSIPEGVWTIGALSETEPTRFTGVILSMLAPSFDVLAIETSSPDVKVEATPLTEEQMETYNAPSGYAIVCEVQPNMPVGSFAERVTVTTSLEDQPEFEFRIQGNRIGPFHVVGPGWQHATQTLRMGRFPAEQGKSVKLSLFASDPGIELQFEQPAVEPPILNVNIVLDESFQAESGRKRFLLTIEAPPGILSGRWSDNSPVVVRIRSNHPDKESALLNVLLQAD